MRAPSDVACLRPCVRATAVAALWAATAALLLTHQVAASPAGALHSRRPRSLLDEDLISTGLSMFSGPRNSCCKQLSLCDLAAVLLQAVAANKAQDADSLRRREAAEYSRMGRFGRFRRADAQVPGRPLPGGEDGDDDGPPNPTLYHITQAFLRMLRAEEEARRQEELRRAAASIERVREAALHDQDYDVSAPDGDQDGANGARTAAPDGRGASPRDPHLGVNPEPASAVQRIARP